MRHILVALVSFALASSALAQVDQPILNLDPGALRSFPVMSEEVPQIARAPQVMRAPEMEPPVTGQPCEAAVVVRSAGKPGTADIFSVSYHVFSRLPIGALIQSWVRKPGGEIYAPSIGKVPIGVLLDNGNGSGWQWWVWNAPLPTKWPEGITTFEVVASFGDWQCTAVARVVTGGVYPAGKEPRFGPLEKATVDSSGGVALLGAWQSEPVVVAPTYLNRKVKLTGNYYVVPGEIGTGNWPLGVCDREDGKPFRLHCSTEIVPIPVF
jgi:hypothetical protein